MRNLAIFHQSTKSQNCDFDFCLKVCHYNEECCKIWKEIDFSVQNWHEEFNEFCRKHWKISKICTLMDCFWPKHLAFELKKTTKELCLMTLNIDANLSALKKMVELNQNKKWKKQIDQMQCENFLLPWKQMDSMIKKTFHQVLQDQCS